MNDLGSFIIFLKTQMLKILSIRNIYLSQSDYINKILNIFKLKNSSLRNTPIKSKLRFIKVKAGKKSSNKFRK